MGGWVSACEARHPLAGPARAPPPAPPPHTHPHTHTHTHRTHTHKQNTHPPTLGLLCHPPLIATPPSSTLRCLNALVHCASPLPAGRVCRGRGVCQRAGAPRRGLTPRLHAAVGLLWLGPLAAAAGALPATRTGRERRGREGGPPVARLLQGGAPGGGPAGCSQASPPPVPGLRLPFCLFLSVEGSVACDLCDRPGPLLTSPAPTCCWFCVILSEQNLLMVCAGAAGGHLDSGGRQPGRHHGLPEG
jgi:hypothetical protein